MGIYNLENPGRAGGDVARFDGMPMALIIREFAFNNDLFTSEYARTQLRRALLVSSEVRAVSKGARFGV